ncbi:hypothetical protein WUBG_09759 [Wuchereria bancrofti]|uniref:Uncharacterized protein n=1 Tax=Wuchereria bancrofti TaxID=6293 RepID=J9EAD8_WUCBA|nr:hypothetical protein WUBG_09759 [Wuchereria bancrofti]
MEDGNKKLGYRTSKCLIRAVIRSDCATPISFVSTRLSHDITVHYERVYHGVHRPHPQVDVPLHFSTEKHFISSRHTPSNVGTHQTITVFVLKPVECRFELPYIMQILERQKMQLI